MADSLAARGIRGLKRKYERVMYGSIGNIPGRAIPADELDRGVRTGKGRKELRRRWGLAGAPVHGDEDSRLSRQLSTGKGRWEYVRGLQRKGK